jgi:PHO85 cyclin-5
MTALPAQQSMPREKRAPPGYLEYSLNNKFRNTEQRCREPVGSASSGVTDNFSDSSSQFSWQPTASQSSAQTTPELPPSYRQVNVDESYLGISQVPVQSLDVPSWRDGVEKEYQNAPPVLPPSQRQNCRRTGPSCPGRDQQHVSPPSTLVRQPERRHCFVSSLVIFAAGLIAAIWPLSAPVLHDTTYAHNVLPLQDFITETLRRSKTSYSTLQVAMYYLVLLKEHLPKCDFTQEQSCILSDRRPMQCGRRMFLSALMLASKFLQDRNYSTRAWGKITGLPTSEINTNELKFLEAVDWRLHVSKEKFERWSHTVIALSAPPKPGTSAMPQPSLVESLGWSMVLDRLTPECLEDFSQFRDSSSLPSSLCDAMESKEGMITPPTTPPDSTISEEEEPTSKLNTPCESPSLEPANQSSPAYRVPPPAPHQQNLPTPRTTPRMPQCPSSLARMPRSAPRCSESSAAMAALKLPARPANRALCPPPQWPCQKTYHPCRQAMSRRSSVSSSASSLSSPESVRSDRSGFSARSRSSSISSVASSVVAPLQGAPRRPTLTHPTKSSSPC